MGGGSVKGLDLMKECDSVGVTSIRPMPHHRYASPGLQRDRVKYQTSLQFPSNEENRGINAVALPSSSYAVC